MRSEEAIMLHQQTRASSGGDKASSELIEKHHFSDKVNEDVDQFVLVQASGKNIFYTGSFSSSYL